MIMQTGHPILWKSVYGMLACGAFACDCIVFAILFVKNIVQCVVLESGMHLWSSAVVVRANQVI